MDEEIGDDEVFVESDELITFRLMADDIISIGSMSKGNRDALGGRPSVCLKSRM